ncbi:transporter substrate-binding domain-containing protein [Streptomyces sp. JNUCC 64]
MWTVSRRGTAACVALALLATVTACAGDEKEKRDFLGLTRVNIAYKKDQPNTSYFMDDKPTGFDAYLGSYVAEELGVQQSEKTVRSKLRETEIIVGKADLVIGTYSITPDREDEVAFVGPYIQTRQGYLVGPKDPYIDTEDGLIGKQVCTIEDSTAAVALRKKGMEVNEVDNASECMDSLLKEEVHAFFLDKMILYGFMEDHLDEELHVIEENIGVPQRYGIAMPKGYPEDCEALKEIVKSYVEGSEWKKDFTASLSSFAEEHPERVESYRPSSDAVDQYSCKG